MPETNLKVKTILIIVELENGNAHQVLATKENKKIMLDMLSVAQGRLMLDKELAPLTLETK